LNDISLHLANSNTRIIRIGLLVIDPLSFETVPSHPFELPSTFNDAYKRRPVPLPRTAILLPCRALQARTVSQYTRALAFAGGTAPPSKSVARAGPYPGHGGLGAKTWPKPHNFGTSPWFQSRNCPCRPGGAATPCAAAPVQPEFVDTRNESLRSSSAFGCWGGRTRRRSMVAHSPWPLSWDPFSLLAYRPLRRSHACWSLPGAGPG
jgi:hypothetical protein